VRRKQKGARGGFFNPHPDAFVLVEAHPVFGLGFMSRGAIAALLFDLKQAACQQ
jgi:hypothetical protein